MGIIPFMEKPTAQVVLEYNGIPCYAEVKRIILAECERNNEILLVGDAASHPSETRVVIDFHLRYVNAYRNLLKKIRMLFLIKIRGAFEPVSMVNR